MQKHTASGITVWPLVEFALTSVSPIDALIYVRSVEYGNEIEKQGRGCVGILGSGLVEPAGYLLSRFGIQILVNLKASELGNGAPLKRLLNLGKNICGYKESLTWYYLRRMVLNAEDSIGSKGVRNQISS